MKVCEKCGVEITIKNRVKLGYNKTHISHKTYFKRICRSCASKQCMDWQKRTFRKRNCLMCGEEFVSNVQSKRKYCSPECRYFGRNQWRLKDTEKEETQGEC